LIRGALTKGNACPSLHITSNYLILNLNESIAYLLPSGVEIKVGEKEMGSLSSYSVEYFLKNDPTKAPIPTKKTPNSIYSDLAVFRRPSPG
jgi:hypothetical protein